MDVEGFLEAVRRDPGYAGQIAHVHTVPARAPRWAALPDVLLPEVRHFLAALGVTRLYEHQAEAVRAALTGADVLITTGPASGKSLCYQIPLLQTFLEDEESTALLLFPAKALARDQAAAWNRGIEAIGAEIPADELTALPYDGDADIADRRLARESGRVLVTNPEMLHMRLLPEHGRWGRLFRGLRYVILDEVHTYAGFFGANMANVVRRLQRLCKHHGSRPQFICSSATVGNPRELAQRVIGRELHHVSEDAAAAGSRTYVFWNPPRIRKRKWRGRRSANVEAHELMVRLIRQGIPTICFGKSRNTAEMIYRYVRESLEKQAPTLADRVIPYRGGYPAEERREMERRLRAGELLGVSATRALELGIDVGVLEACIVIGYPGWLHAFHQQMGRAGRSGRDCLCVLVGTDTIINQYIMSHPKYVFGRPVEREVVDCDNPFVVLGHVRCATAELPVRDSERDAFGYATPLALDVLEEEQKVRHIEDAWYHASSEAPAFEVRLRGYGDESTVVMEADSETVIDRLDKFRSLRIFYPGAIYFHRGNTYRMVEHDFERNVVLVRRVDVNYYTDPITGTAVDHVDRILEQRPLGTGRAFLGEVFAVLGVGCYEKVQFYTVERMSQHETHVPPIAYDAMSFWLAAPPDLVQNAARSGLNADDGMRGILYCVSRVLPLFLTSDANDFDWSLGCRNAPWHTLFWFEFYMHGIGHAEQCYERLEEILHAALEQMLTCDCEDGCPNCTSRLITPYHVRNVELGEGLVHSRRAAVVVLNSLLTGQSVEESIALIDAPPDKRGQQFLPSVIDAPRLSRPHRLPLDERTRRLMLRKVERMRNPKLPVDHAIDIVPPEGMPAVETEASLKQADAAKRSGHGAIRKTGNDLARRLRRRLELGAASAEANPDGPTPSPPAEQQKEPPPQPERTPIRAGDSIAARARKLKRRSTQGREPSP